jgi:hypothetical protein
MRGILRGRSRYADEMRVLWQGQGLAGSKNHPDTHCVTQRCAPSVWGRLATCAAVGYRRRSAASAAVGRAQRAPPIGRSLPSCPTMPDLPLSVGTPFFMKFRGPKAHPNRPHKAMVCPTGLAYLRSSGVSTPSFFRARRSGRGGPCRGTLTSTQRSSPGDGREGSGTCSGMKKATGSRMLHGPPAKRDMVRLSA